MHSSGTTMVRKNSANNNRHNGTRTMERKKKRGHLQHIVIVTAYRVVQKAIKQAWPTMAYAQRWAVCQQQGIGKPEPRLQCIKDLKHAIKEWKKEECDIILMIDANKPMGKDSNGISSIASECNLINIHVANTSNQPTLQHTPEYRRKSTSCSYRHHSQQW